MEETVQQAYWKANKLFQISSNLTLLDRPIEAYRFEKEARQILIDAGVEPASTYEMAYWAKSVCEDYMAGKITTQRDI